MVKRIINRVLCAALVTALLLPSFCVDVRAEEIIDISDNQEIEIVEEEAGEEPSELWSEDLVVEAEDHPISEEDTYGSSFGNMQLAFDGDPEERIEDIDSYLGYREIPSERDFQRYSDAAKEKGDLSLETTLPSSYTTSTLPPTRNQNPYGSCWAHAAMACAEINQKNAALNLSELHFAYFTYHTPLDPLGGLDGDSNSFVSSKDFMQFGGDTIVASNVLTNWVGPANESDVPYSDAAGVISGTKTISTDKAYYDAFHVQDYYLTDPVDDRDSTKRLIRDYGAVAASYYALLEGYGFSGTNYSFSNVYNKTKCAYYLPLENTGTNHAITLVGWDDNFSKSNFGWTPEGDGAWLVRNSWTEGKSVSQKSYESYFWLSYYDKSLSHKAVAYRVESADNYDNNYQYDGTMTDMSTFLAADRRVCIKNANVFTAKGSLTGEQLKAVSFGTYYSDVNYTIEIYKGLTGTKPNSGSLAATLTGTTVDAGYYTIKLNNSIQLENGEKYSVVVYFDDPNVDIFAEAGNNSSGYANGEYYSWNCVAHMDAGESFWGYDWGGTPVWNDYATDSRWYGGNVRIKAYTTDNPSIPGMGTNVTLTLDANGGTFSSGSTKMYKSVITGYEYGVMQNPTRTGYEFTGWYTKIAAGEGSKIESTSQVDNYENHTLYAHWDALEYTVTFDANDGICGTASKKVKFDGKYGELPVATRNRWTFEGWFRAPVGGVEITAQTTVSLADDHTLYAHWSELSGDITDEDKDVLIQKYGEDYEIPEGLWIAGLITYENEYEEAKKYTYTGSAIKPEIRVYDGNRMLKEKVDYSVSYKNNVNVAKADKINAKGVSIAPTVTVTGKGNYKGSDTARFEIAAKAIGTPDGVPAEDIVVSDPAMVIFNKKDQKPVPAITYGKKKLAAKNDYIVSYYRKEDIGDNADAADFAGREADAVIPRDAGSYYVLLSAKEGGNYSGSVIKSLVIGQAEEVPVSKLSIKKITDKKYTGNAVYPEDTDFVVKDGRTELVLGTDYEVSYIPGMDYTNIGTVDAVITGLGKYIGSKAVSYKIVGRQMKSVKIDNFVKSFDGDKSYDGNAKTMDSLGLSYPDKTTDIPEEVIWKTETEYEGLSDNEKKKVGCIVSYLNNTNAGTATLVLTGVNAYTGTVKKTFKVNPRTMSTVDPDILIELDEITRSYPYEKSGTNPEPTVSYKGTVLTPGKDYTISYLNNTAVNDGSNPKKLPTIKITGKGNFKGTDATTYFYIEKGELNDPAQGITISVSDKVYVKKAGNWKSNVTVTDGKGKKLAQKTDYVLTYSYEDGAPISDVALVSAGTVIKVTITGTDKNYSADCSLSETYKIVPKDINKLKASILNQNRAYTGKQIKPGKDEIVWSGEIPDEDDFEIIGYANNINKGKASVIIKGSGENYGGTKTITFNITTKVFSWWPW